MATLFSKERVYFMPCQFFADRDFATFTHPYHVYGATNDYKPEKSCMGAEFNAEGYHGRYSVYTFPEGGQLVTMNTHGRYIIRPHITYDEDWQALQARLDNPSIIEGLPAKAWRSVVATFDDPSLAKEIEWIEVATDYPVLWFSASDKYLAAENPRMPEGMRTPDEVPEEEWRGLLPRFMEMADAGYYPYAQTPWYDPCQSLRWFDEAWEHYLYTECDIASNLPDNLINAVDYSRTVSIWAEKLYPEFAYTQFLKGLEDIPDDTRDYMMERIVQAVVEKRLNNK